MMNAFVSGISLFVEGNVDTQLMRALVGTTGLRVTVTPEGAKYGLANKVKQARATQSKDQKFYYLRDRDFDFEGVEWSEQVPRSIADLGWHWCRHEIENYLLEPEILRRYLSIVIGRDITLEEVTEAICYAATSIRYYQAARWTIGRSRQKGLPYPSNLETRPSNVDEFRLPETLGEEVSIHWALDSTKNYIQRVSNALEETEVRKQYQFFEQMFTEENCRNVQWVLHYCSGKDLFAALQPWFEKIGITRNTKRFVEEDFTPWVSTHMATLLPFVSEWKAVLAILQSL